MKSYIKKLIMSMMFLLSLGLIGCGKESSILLNEHYLKANFDNNYEEIKIKSENLDSDQYDINLEENLISITDKKSEGIDKIEYAFDENNLYEVRFRRNSKDVTTVKSDNSNYFIGDTLYYIEGGVLVNSMSAQCDFLNGKNIPDNKIIKIDKVLLDTYSSLDLGGTFYKTSEHFKSIASLSKNHEFYEEDDINQLSLINTINNSKIVVTYMDKNIDDEHGLPIKRVAYYADGGKIIEANFEKRLEVSSFKVYKNEDDEGKEVESFQEQIDFLRNNSL